MATVKSLVAGLNDAELAGCVSEAVAWQDGKQLAGTLLRNCAKRLVEELGIDDESSLQIAEAHLLREAAIRFARQVPGQ
jgi:hypothetical protein